MKTKLFIISFFLFLLTTSTSASVKLSKDATISILTCSPGNELYSLFGHTGIRVVDNTFFHSVEEGAKAALDSGAEIVVICAADDDYATLAPKAKELLGERALFVVAGAPASQPELEAQGITRFISVRSNVLETLREYVKELGI